MKNLLLLSFLLLVISFPFNSHAQWTSNGPYGGWVSCTSKVGNNIYVGTATGVFKSTDDGETYKLWSQNLPVAGVEELFFDGTTMYCGVDQLGVYTSQDTGKTWATSQTGIGEPYQFDYPFVMVNNKVFSHNEAGCFYTTDHGQTWTQLTYPHNLSQYFALFTAVGNTLFKMNNTNDTLYRSVNEGQTWTKASTGLFIDIDNSRVNQIYKVGNTLYLFCQLVYTSTDDGVSWTPMTHHTIAGPNPYDLIFTAAKVAYDGHSFYGTNGGDEYVFVFKIAPGDTQWVNITHTVPDGFSTSLFSSGTKIIINKDNTLYETTDGGATWTVNNNSGIIASIVYSLYADRNAIYTGRQTDISRSTNNGQSWQKCGSNLPYNITAIRRFGSNLFAAVSGFELSKSTDNGNTWTDPVESYSSWYCLTDDGTNLYEGGATSDQAVVNKSANGGTTFDDFHDGLPEGVVVDLLALGNNLYAAVGVGQSDTAGVYKTSTTTAAWKLKINGMTINDPLTLANIGNTLYAGVYYGGVYKSTDFAESWAPVGTGIENRTVNKLLVSWSDLFAGTDSGVYVLHSGSNTWEDISMNLPIRSVNALAVNDDYLFAGTEGAATWQIDLTAVGIKDIAKEKPQINIYPNPSSGSFVVQMPQHITGNVSLTVMDELGKIIYDRQYSSSEKNVLISGSRWATGIYFIRINSVDESLTQKLILTRDH